MPQPIRRVNWEPPQSTNAALTPQQADDAWRLATQAKTKNDQQDATLAIIGTIVDREVPTIAAGPPTTLTLVQTPKNDACCIVWRGAGDGWAMTTAWSRAGKVITLTNPRIDANEFFQVSYRY